MAVITGSSDFFSSGHVSLNTTATLHTEAVMPCSGNANLYTKGISTPNDYRPLFIQGFANPLNTTLPLSIIGLDVGVSVEGIGVTVGGILVGLGEGDASAIYDIGRSQTLFLDGEPDINETLPLFLKNTEANVLNNLSMPLFLFSNNYTGNFATSVPLYIANSGITESFNLFVDGDGLWDDYMPSIGSMPLFINRPNESIGLPLFLKAVDNIVNGTSNLFIKSTISSSENLTLVLPGVTQSLNNISALFINGIVEKNNLINLFIDGKSELFNNMHLYVRQGNTPINSINTLYIYGANKENNMINLVLPHVYSVYNNSFPIYVFGW